MTIEDILIGLLEIIDGDYPRCGTSVIEEAENYIRGLGYRKDGLTGKYWIKDSPHKG